MTQSIVVYSPIENSLYNDGMLLPLVGGLGTAFVVFILLMVWAERIFGNHKVNDLATVGAATIALIAGALTFQWLFI